MSRSRGRAQPKAASEELLPGLSPALLQALHLMTKDGALNADARRKLKQVQHLIRLLQPALDDILARHPEPVVLDCGAGKSYLGLILAQLVLEPAGKGVVVGLETRQELVDRARSIATASGLTRAYAVHGEVDRALLPERVHLVTALHACDTATDDALALALEVGADHIAVVPCCQAEVARQLGAKAPPDEAISILAAHPLHRRELGSQLTNAIRALVLESRGYQVTVTELTGWEHSLKNELILGRRVHRESVEARRRLDALLSATGVEPKLCRVLR